MPDVAVTVAALLQEAAARFRAAGIAEPRREAARLWSDLADQTDSGILRDQTASAETLARFTQAVARRAGGEPLAHVTGLAGFRRLTLLSDRRALIPRPETEGLVELVLQRQPGGRVVDVGTGSGCIALSLADEGRYDQVIGVEWERAALALARENRCRVDLPITLVAGDLLSGFADQTVDTVVSNPPYLTESEYAQLDPAVRAWEPGSALASGADGLDATRRLMGQAIRVTRPGGWLALEVDAARAELVATVASQDGWRDVTVHMDLFGRARFVLARRSEAG